MTTSSIQMNNKTAVCTWNLLLQVIRPSIQWLNTHSKMVLITFLLNQFFLNLIWIYLKSNLNRNFAFPFSTSIQIQFNWNWILKGFSIQFWMAHNPGAYIRIWRPERLWFPTKVWNHYMCRWHLRCAHLLFPEPTYSFLLWKWLLNYGGSQHHFIKSPENTRALILWK